MKILSVHNAYQQYGGEDTVFAAERDLLKGAGHEVETLCVSNESIDTTAAKICAAVATIHSWRGREMVAEAIRGFQPDVVHVHNLFPLISPSMFYATASAGVPSVWTLHNFRTACANGLLFRDGGPCEDCVGHIPAPAILHRCYRNSLSGSSVVAAAITFHNALRTWHNKVDRFIALSDFAREIFVRAGLPAGKISVKVNFIQDPIQHCSPPSERKGVVYVGRLSPEKGLHVLVRAWHSIDVPLTIVGSGPDLSSLQAAAPNNVSFAGHLNHDDVCAVIAKAQAIVIPSIWYENCPMTMVEAMALGTPVIASRAGALAEFIEDKVSGFHFTPGDSEDLARVTKEALATPSLMASVGTTARLLYESRFSPAQNLRRLIQIYDDAIRESSARR